MRPYLSSASAALVMLPFGLERDRSGMARTRLGRRRIMTAEQSRRAAELFAKAREIPNSERPAWLRTECGDDAIICAEVLRLLAEHSNDPRDDVATESARRPSEETRSWFSGKESLPSYGTAKSDSVGASRITGVTGFSPRAVIASMPRSQMSEAAEADVRPRLRELPIIHILTLAMANFWRCHILRDDDPALSWLDAIVIGLLAGLFALLCSRWHGSLAWLRGLELGLVGLLAARLVIVEYRVVLRSSIAGDAVTAQFVTKNVVLLIAILIPSYGLYVPKNWRLAAAVVGPLAVLPFATILALYLGHPEAMDWLRHGWKSSQTPRFLLFSFDATTLVLLALASTLGAGVITRLRRQVAEARSLGQYRLRRQIGAGGMGEVYLAEHQLLKRPCALKLIRPECVADPRSLARFEREVCLTAGLSHPNTIEIYDYGRTEKGTYYYVMEYLPGLSLSELVERHGPLPPGRVVYLLRQVCSALHEAHAAGLIHRDIKPSNIMVSSRGGANDVAKLLDFGLVLPLPGTGAPHLSGEQQVLGTPLFMSPEQATTAGTLDARSDIYSLGAVAYFLLTGRPPFAGEGPMQVLIAHARDPVEHPSRINENIPQDLESVILRCLMKSPNERYTDTESMERALGACACATDWDHHRATRWWETLKKICDTAAADGLSAQVNERDRRLSSTTAI